MDANKAYKVTQQAFERFGTPTTLLNPSCGKCSVKKSCMADCTTILENNDWYVEKT